MSVALQIRTAAVARALDSATSLRDAAPAVADLLAESNIRTLSDVYGLSRVEALTAVISAATERLCGIDTELGNTVAENAVRYAGGLREARDALLHQSIMDLRNTAFHRGMNE